MGWNRGEGGACAQTGTRCKALEAREFDLHPTSHRRPLEDLNTTRFVWKSNAGCWGKWTGGGKVCDSEPREETAAERAGTLSGVVAVKMGINGCI